MIWCCRLGLFRGWKIRLDVLIDLYPQVCRTSVRLNLEVVRSLVLKGMGRRIPGESG